MWRNNLRILALGSCLCVAMLAAAWNTQSQDSKTPYPSMAPADQYMMERNAEISLARSAGPESISKDAGIMVLGSHGYEVAVKGTNGFVCLVERSWTSPSDSPDFWNPKLRGPLCLNPPAVRTYLPLTIRKTELVLAGRSKAQMFEGIKTGLDNKELPPLEYGAMSYMLSKQGNLGDGNGHWRPHLMFFIPLTEPETWGSGSPGAQLIGIKDPEDRLTIFLVPVAKWSDGTPDRPDDH